MTHVHAVTDDTVVTGTLLSLEHCGHATFNFGLGSCGVKGRIDNINPTSTELFF